MISLQDKWGQTALENIPKTWYVPVLPPFYPKKNGDRPRLKSTPENKWGQTTFEKHFENVVCPRFTPRDPTAPKIVDPSKPGTALELPQIWESLLEKNSSNARVYSQEAFLKEFGH
ncbi:hypothetical protein [Pseudomonas zeae]|uniref:Uncharacterized protein n=1 Tax=Pseudomonas zeae TaxID=2745510 RepID=A0ABU5BPD9_9PSED|nr:hypothetical protein [Pseudomonas zeae]MDX9678152.1 hypothetical protein [Pseudomonas zeae]